MKHGYPRTVVTYRQGDPIASSATYFAWKEIHAAGVPPNLAEEEVRGPALELLPGMEPSTILTSGPPQPFAAFVGGQRDAIIGAALFEGLAPDREEAVANGRVAGLCMCECFE